MRSDSFRAAAESKDFAAAPDLFTDDVSFRSPVVYKPYEGRDALLVVLGAVVQVFEDFRYVEQVSGNPDNVFATMDSIDSYRVKAVESMAKTVDALEQQISRSKSYVDRSHSQS